MGEDALYSLPDAASGHGLFGLREATPSARAIAGALRRAYRVQHDLGDLGMSEEAWARLFSHSRG